MNLIGFVQALLINIGVIAGLNDPQYKVTPVGFLNMLLENEATARVSNASNLREGLDRELKVRYLQRGLESEVSDKDDCETPIGAVWKETSLGKPLFGKIGLFISDNEMRKYQDEANKTLSVGTPQAPLMLGLYNLMLTKLNGLISKINSDLVSAQATKWGVNAATGANTAVNVNFTNSIAMQDGITKLLLDWQANEIAGSPVIVGNGVVNAWQLAQSMKTGIDSGGFGRAQIKYYDDVATVAKWGANHFGMFAPGFTAFVDYQKNVGSFAGVKGGSVFFTLPIPVVLANGTLTKLVLDGQLKYEDCPIFNDEGTKIADRGWKLILSKNYGLFNAPEDMFADGDRLKGFNGALHYIGAAV